MNQGKHTNFLSRAVPILALIFVANLAQAADDRGTVKGVISNSSGAPVVGAFVRLRNAERRLTFMVISQQNGAYNAAELPPGRYIVQGVGAQFQSDPSQPIDVAAGGSAILNVALTKTRGPILPPAWPKRIPEAQQASLSKEFPPNPNRDLVAARCGACHTSDRIIAYRPEREEWENTVSRMRMRMVSAGMPDMTDDETKKVVDYLSVSFPPIQPYDPNSRLPTQPLQGKALNYRVVTFDLPSDFVEPHDVAMSPQGFAWFADHAGTKLGRFDPRTFEFVEKPLPAGTAPPNRQSLGNPQIDARGVLWVSDGPNARWLSYDTKTDAAVVYQWPKAISGGAGGNSMAVNPNGTIWATGANKGVRVFDPNTMQFRSYESPSANGKKAPGAYGIAIAGDGSVWWAEDAVDKMARLDPVSEKVEEYKIPYDGRAFPRRMNVDGNGDLWVGLWDAGKLMKIDHNTKEMKIYTPPSQTGGNYSVVVDKKNNYIWVSEHQVDKIARFDPKTEEWTEFPLPYAESDPRRIDIDPLNPNRVFFSGDTARRMGFVEVLP